MTNGLRVKTASSTWSSIIAKAKTGASTWTRINTVYVKTGASTWTTVFGTEDVRPTATQDTQVSGTYGFYDVGNTYNGSLGDTSNYGYSSAVTGETVGQDGNCSPVVSGDAGVGYTIFSFDPGVSVLQNEAVINIKYKRNGSYSGDNMFGSAIAFISYATDATNNTGGGSYNSLVSCDDTDFDATVQTFQQTISGPLNRQNFKISVGAAEAIYVEVTGLGDCDTPPPYDEKTSSAGFLIYDIYVTFR